MTTTQVTLPIHMIDIVRYKNWTGLTVAQLFHAGRLGSNGSDKKNIERFALNMHQPRDLDEHHALMALANDAYEYLLNE